MPALATSRTTWRLVPIGTMCCSSYSLCRYVRSSQTRVCPRSRSSPAAATNQLLSSLSNQCPPSLCCCPSLRESSTRVGRNTGGSATRATKLCPYVCVSRLARLELYCNRSLEAELTALGEFPTLTYVSSSSRMHSIALLCSIFRTSN